MTAKQRIDISSEMVAFVGEGAIGSADLPAASIPFLYEFGGEAVSSVTLTPEREEFAAAPLVLFVARVACERLFPGAPLDGGRWHLPAELRAIAVAIARGKGTLRSRATLQLAKSIELFHATMSALEEGTLMPVADGALGSTETGRIIAARRVIDERWKEPLTLDLIARAAGINRTQLTRGFRLVYACTIGEALSRSRLDAAKDMILRTETPIARIGFECGYRNNASFSRAFSRRFGQAPSELRKAAA